jgi:hypothetical protein
MNQSQTVQSSKQPQISSVFSTAKRATHFDHVDTSIHLPINISNLGKKRAGTEDPETAESTKKIQKSKREVIVGKRNNNLSQMVTVKPEEGQEQRNAKKKRGIKGKTNSKLASLTILI